MAAQARIDLSDADGVQVVRFRDKQLFDDHTVRKRWPNKFTQPRRVPARSAWFWIFPVSIWFLAPCSVN